MLREQQDAPKRPPCAVCGKPSLGGFYDTQLCDSCHSDWQRDAPRHHELEMKHAEAHPEDVEERGTLQYHTVGMDPRWVRLKPGVTVRLARESADAWLAAQRKARAA